MTYRRTADFLLYDWLNVESLQTRTRFADHSRETFAQVMDTCERIAREKVAPFSRLADTEEPWFDGERVHLPQATHDAAKAYAESGMLAAARATATPYLQAFGPTVLAWMWLDVALCVAAQAGSQPQATDAPLHAGLMAACHYFFRYELPKVPAWLAVVETRDDTCRSMQDAWF